MRFLSIILKFIRQLEQQNLYPLANYKDVEESIKLLHFDDDLPGFIHSGEPLSTDFDRNLYFDLLVCLLSTLTDAVIGTLALSAEVEIISKDISRASKRIQNLKKKVKRSLLSCHLLRLLIFH